RYRFLACETWSVPMRELCVNFFRRMRFGICFVALSVAATGFMSITAPSALAAPARLGSQVTPGNAAESFVQQQIDSGYQVLNAKISEPQRRAQFHDF